MASGDHLAQNRMQSQLQTSEQNRHEEIPQGESAELHLRCPRDDGRSREHGHRSPLRVRLLTPVQEPLPSDLVFSRFEPAVDSPQGWPMDWPNGPPTSPAIPVRRRGQVEIALTRRSCTGSKSRTPTIERPARDAITAMNRTVYSHPPPVETCRRSGDSMRQGVTIPSRSDRRWSSQPTVRLAGRGISEVATLAGAHRPGSDVTWSRCVLQ